MKTVTIKQWIYTGVISSILTIVVGTFAAINISRDDGNWHGPNDGGNPTVAVGVNSDFDSMLCENVIPADDGGGGCVGLGCGGGGGGGSMRGNAP